MTAQQGCYSHLVFPLPLHFSASALIFHKAFNAFFRSLLVVSLGAPLLSSFGMHACDLVVFWQGVVIKLVSWSWRRVTPTARQWGSPRGARRLVRLKNHSFNNKTSSKRDIRQSLRENQASQVFFLSSLNGGPVESALVRLMYGNPSNRGMVWNSWWIWNSFEWHAQAWP